MNRRSLLLGAALAALLASPAVGSFQPLSGVMLNALDYNIKGDGATDDSAAVQTFVNLVTTQSAYGYFPGGGKRYIMGGNSVTVLDGTNILCQSDAVFVRTADTTQSPNPTVAYGTYTAAMFALGNHCRWTGGVMQNTAIFTTSSTSVNLGTLGSSTTITIGTNLNIDVGFTDFRFWSAANPVNRFEGFISAYAPLTGVATLSGIFIAGTGTHTDWQVTFGGLFQCPMVLHNVTDTVVEYVRTTGFWYVGLIMEAWNPAGPVTLLTSNCTFRNCWAESVQNRPYYLYGNCSDNTIVDCWALGGTGVSDYGANFNPANVGVGAGNSINRNTIVNFKVIGTWGQGIAFGAACIQNTATDCKVTGVVGPAGVGYLVESVFNGTANQNAQFNKFIGCDAINCISQGFAFIGANRGGAWSCTAQSCGTAFVVSPSADATPIQCSSISLNGCEGLSSTTANFTVAGNSTECSLNGIESSGSVTGVLIGTGAVNTLITGRSQGNTTNITNSGTGTILSGLSVV